MDDTRPSARAAHPLSLAVDNRFLRDLPGDPLTGTRPRQVEGALWSAVEPTPVPAPRLLAWSDEVASALGLDAAALNSPDALAVLAGNAPLPGSRPWATCYGGHQFGHWAGQLGDGRAISLGEVLGRDGKRLELQLKGAGPTPYSRRADGRAVLRSSIREFLCSEAMHHLGIPTTRALSLVATGDSVIRDMFYDGRPAAEPGAIVCRVAPSFTRFGHFELPASRGDEALLERLVEFTIARDFAECPWNRAVDPADAAGLERRRADWFTEICERTARLIAQWMRVGFVHGVMNTDNLSIAGLTIDYGPYGWLEYFDPDWTPNTTDAQNRRYRFGNQVAVAHWNLACLAGALLPLFGSEDPLHAGLDRFKTVSGDCAADHAIAKLGLLDTGTTRREQALTLMQRLQGLMQSAMMDMTITFRTLASIDPHAPEAAAWAVASGDPARFAATSPALSAWLTDWSACVRADALGSEDRAARMNQVNPRYVLRNYLAQQVIDRAEAGDSSGIGELLDVLRRPYDDQPEQAALAARPPDWARNRPGCSMLSCSS